MGRTNEFGYLGAGPDQTASANTGVFNFTEVNNLTSDGAFATAGSTDIIELLVLTVMVEVVQVVVVQVVLETALHKQ